MANAECASTYSCGSACASAPCYGVTENVGIVAVVVTELELRDVQGQIFAADLVIGAHHTALNQRPEPFNRVRVDGTNNIFARAVPDDLMREAAVQVPIAGVFIGCEQTDLVRHGFMNEAVQSASVCVVDDAGNDVALAFDGADDGKLASGSGADKIALVLVFVRGLPTDIGFVNLDNAHELAEIGIKKARANAVAHIVRGRIRTEAHHALDLKGTDTLLAGQHEIDDLEPRLETNVRVLEDRSDQHREPIAALGSAFGALPVERLVGDGINVRVPATGAVHAVMPAAPDQILLAGVIGREQLFKLRDRHLFRKTGHFGLPCPVETEWHSIRN